MKGFRKDNPNDEIPEIGQYGKGSDGVWFGNTPNGMLANLGNHEVKELPDGTITATPSILVTSGTGKTWHGYLTEGEWSSC